MINTLKVLFFIVWMGIVFYESTFIMFSDGLWNFIMGMIGFILGARFLWWILFFVGRDYDYVGDGIQFTDSDDTRTYNLFIVIKKWNVWYIPPEKRKE